MLGNRPRIAVVCHCGESDCEEWAMVSIDDGLMFYVNSGQYEIPENITSETQALIDDLK
jgi:hypothetical protein